MIRPATLERVRAALAAIEIEADRADITDRRRAMAEIGEAIDRGRREIEATGRKLRNLAEGRPDGTAAAEAMMAGDELDLMEGEQSLRDKMSTLQSGIGELSARHRAEQAAADNAETRIRAAIAQALLPLTIEIEAAAQERFEALADVLALSEALWPLVTWQGHAELAETVSGPGYRMRSRRKAWPVPEELRNALQGLERFAGLARVAVPPAEISPR